MRLPSTAAALAALLSLRPAAAEQATPPVVVELFTSQSCSSCPPAEAVLAELARAPEGAGLLPLAFHVTYWDRLGWRDRFSLPEATERQRRYAALLRRDTVYTPQVVVQGRTDALGSDRRAVLGAVAGARAAAAAGPSLALAEAGGDVALSAGAGTGAGTLWLVGFDPRQTTAVRGGEKAGRTTAQANVVRSLHAVGEWRGVPLRLDVPRPAAGERVAALLRAPDGAIRAAALLPAAAAGGG